MVGARDLFDESRSPFGWSVVPFILYFPIGVLLALVRAALGAQLLVLAAILARISPIRRLLVRWTCHAMGLVLQRDFSASREPLNPRVPLVANHLTPLDMLVLHAATDCRCSVPVVTSEGGLAKTVFARALGSQGGAKGPPLLLPEGTTTHGRTALMAFQHQAFGEQCREVRPCAVVLWRPPVGFTVSHCVLGASWWEDVFWTLFVPCNVFCLRYLPVVRRTAQEEVPVLAGRAETAIASCLGVQRSGFSAADKRELEKRRRPPCRPAQQHRATATSQGPEIARMVAQVSEVLPYVPADVLRKDLARTRSVDVTISNILEGVVTFTPVPLPAAVPAPAVVPVPCVAPSSTPGPSPSPSSSSLHTGAPSFPRSAHERSLSFTERKARLLENARRRYIEKHGLDLAKFG